MGALLGLALGTGLLLVWSAWRSPTPTGRRGVPGDRIAVLLARAGLAGARPTGVVLLSAGAGLVVLLLVQALSRTLPVSAAFGLMAAYAPWGILRQRAVRRQRELAAVWPEAVDNLASGVRAGLSLPDAVSALAVNGPEALRSAFEEFALDHQVTGRFDDALDRLKDRLADPVGDRVVEGLRVAREVGGGDLGRLLRNLSGFLRDEARTRSELESRQAWTINGARLAVAAPWLVLLMMSAQTSVVQRYASPAGVVVLGIGATACLGAYRLMMRIGRLPTEKRVLA